VALREVYAFKTGDLAAALETGRHAIGLDFGGAPQARSAAHCIYASALYFSGSIDEARVAFRRAVQLAEEISDLRSHVYAVGYLALIAAESGRLAEAEHEIRRATGVGAVQGGGEHFVNAMASLAAATVFDAHGDAAAAADAAHLAVELACRGGGVLEVAKARALRAEILEHRRDRAAPATARQGPAVEELTAREREVLRLLATRLSRREIAQRLYVSLNTVKTHQRAVYRKLGVENRAAAVMRARELGLR
jgi:LuxR family maltose regulon positive regulatory protein